MAGKLPYFPFYPADWVRDTRILSLETRAVWIDLLTLMHDSDRRGYLTSRLGSPFSPEQIAAYCGTSREAVTRATQELIDSGVASCTDSGILYSRRMVADERKRRLCSDAGKRGGGNPTFKGKPKRPAKPPPKLPLNMTSDNEVEKPRKGKKGGAGGEGGTVPPELEHPEFLAAWKEWLTYLREKRKAPTPSTIRAQLAKLAAWGKDRAVIAIRESIAHGWQGLFAGEKGESRDAMFDRLLPGGKEGP